jgi:hypothetical protein
VDLTWEGGHLQRAIVHSRRGSRCELRYGASTASLDTLAGEAYDVTLQLTRPAA